MYTTSRCKTYRLFVIKMEIFCYSFSIPFFVSGTSRFLVIPMSFGFLSDMNLICLTFRFWITDKTGHETEAGKVKAASSPNISPSSCSSVKTLEDSEDKGNGTRELHELYLRNTVPTKVMDARETNFILAGGGSSTRKTHSSDTNSTSHIRAILAEPTTEVAEGHPHQLKKYRASGGMTLNSMRSHKLEAGILDLEELVNKVKWLKSILECGIPLSNAAKPQWKVMEHIASSSMSK